MVCLELFRLMAFIVVESTALSTPIRPSLNTTTVVATTRPYLPPSTSLHTSLSENLTAHGWPICTNDPQWRLPGDPSAGIYAGACSLALQTLGNMEIISPAQRRFMTATARGDFRIPQVRTPRRYIGNRKTQYRTFKADKGSSNTSSGSTWKKLCTRRHDAG